MSQPTEAFGRTIQLFLVDGTPSGLTIASIHGWTGSVLVATQSTFARLLLRGEADRTGVYILFGPDPEDALSMRAYIGEADSVRDRIGQSAAERGFWETAVVITTSDEALTKGHVRYLEARLIEITKSAGRVTLDNHQSPDADKRRMPEADRANMEAFLANLRTILPVIGLDLLKPRPASVTRAAPADTFPSRTTFEIRHKSGVKATGVDEEGEFVVLQGSQALRDTGYQNTSYHELKQDLIDQGILTVAPDGKYYTFVKPYAFRSPSAASAVVLDRNSNGRIEWKVSGSGNSYHDWQRDKAGAADIPTP